MKLIGSRLHGILDFVVVAFLWIAPLIFQFEDPVKYFTYGLGLVHFLLTLVTKFEVGLVKIVPLSVHGWIEFIVSISLFVFSFWLRGQDFGGEFAFRFYFILACAIFLVWMVTDYKPKGKMSPLSSNR